VISIGQLWVPRGRERLGCRASTRHPAPRGLRGPGLSGLGRRPVNAPFPGVTTTADAVAGEQPSTRTMIGLPCSAGESPSLTRRFGEARCARESCCLATSSARARCATILLRGRSGGGRGRTSGHPLPLVRRAERPAGARQRPAVPPRPEPGRSDRLRRRGRDGRGRGERGLASLLQLGFVPAPGEAPEPSDGSPGLRVRGQLISPPRGLSRRLVHNGIQSYCVAHVGDMNIFTDMTGRQNATGFDLGFAARQQSVARETGRTRTFG
jgi:hypothetical protein